MVKQSGRSAFPTIFLTFSVLLLVFAVGFVVGRLVVAQAYLRTAPKFEKRADAADDSTENRAPDRYAAPGGVHVPAPPGGPPDDGPFEQAPPPDEVDSEPSGPAERADSRPAEEPVTPPPPTPTSTSRDRAYSVQVGVFNEQAGAQGTVDELRRAGYSCRVEKQERGEGTVYRVLSGSYRTEDEARAAAERLAGDGFPAFMVRP